MSDQACCACLMVQYKPRANADGTMSERWVCALGDHEFVRKGVMDYRLAERQALVESLTDELRNFVINADETLLRKVYGDAQFERSAKHGRRVVEGALSDVLRQAAKDANDTLPPSSRIGG